MSLASARSEVRSLTCTGTRHVPRSRRWTLTSAATSVPLHNTPAGRDYLTAGHRYLLHRLCHLSADGKAQRTSVYRGYQSRGGSLRGGRPCDRARGFESRGRCRGGRGTEAADSPCGWLHKSFGGSEDTCSPSGACGATGGPGAAPRHATRPAAPRHPDAIKQPSRATHALKTRA